MSPRPILATLLCIFFSTILLAQNKNPFESIGKKGKILTLSKGQYEELFDQDSIQQIGTALVNVRQMKVVKLLKDEEAKKLLDNSIATRFLSVDPLQVHYPELTPYQFASNRPIEAVDLDGKEAKDLFMELEPIRSHRDNEKRNGIVHPESAAEKGLRHFVTFGLGVFTLPVIYFTAEAAITGVLANSLTAMNVTVNTLTWVSNTNNLLAASTVGGFVFELINPDPNGSYIDLPGSGEEFGRAVKMAFRTKGGKAVEFIAEKGARFANESEFHWAGKLLDEGRNVTLLKESSEPGVRTADFLVDKVLTEIKDVANVKGTDAGKLSDGIANVIKRSTGQASHLILDLTKQAGATIDVAKRAAARYWGYGETKETIRIVGQGYDEVLRKSDFKKPKTSN